MFKHVNFNDKIDPNQAKNNTKKFFSHFLSAKTYIIINEDLSKSYCEASFLSLLHLYYYKFVMPVMLFCAMKKATLTALK